MPLRALVLTSNALRHQYFVSQVASKFKVVGVMNEPKKNYFTQARAESSLVEAHFGKLANSERDFFGELLHGGGGNTIAPMIITDLNAPEAVETAINLAPDIVCLFGTSILKTPWLEAFPDQIINLHLGLSPYYRGAATLFWPFYDGRLECLGTTIHLAIAKVDAGAILKRIKPRFEVGDDYYRITTRLIRDSLEQFPQIAAYYLEGVITPQPQEYCPNARIMKKADFNEAALKKALTYLGDGLTEEMMTEIGKSAECPC